MKRSHQGLGDPGIGGVTLAGGDDVRSNQHVARVQIGIEAAGDAEADDGAAAGFGSPGEQGAQASRIAAGADGDHAWTGGEPRLLRKAGDGEDGERRG